jgi:hypothetical protein
MRPRFERDLARRVFVFGARRGVLGFFVFRAARGALAARCLALRLPAKLHAKDPGEIG